MGWQYGPALREVELEIKSTQLERRSYRQNQKMGNILETFIQ